MKFPFDFSLSLVFRLVFPGVVLTAALWPVIVTLLKMAGIDHNPQLSLPIAAVIFGWLVVLADQPIYMLYEGRRWWPSKALEFFTAREAARLKFATEKAKELRVKNPDDGAYLEYEIDKLDFPINEKGEYFALFPTRLGNIITAFETYSDTAWGIDSIFYWPRLWVVLDKDTRALLDETQAIADGALYVSFALTLSAMTFILYGVGGFLAFIPKLHRFDLPHLPAPWWTLLVALILWFLSRIIYWLALSQQRTYGDLFKSLFDQYREKLGFAADAAQVAFSKGNTQQGVLDSKYGVAARYLRWHRILPANYTKSVTPEEWAASKVKPSGAP